jgi:type IV secretion system protein VirB1
MLEGCILQGVLGDIPVAVMRAVVTVESSHNPFAVGVVGDRLVRQPKSLDEAVATVKRLESLGKNYSVGLAQLNRSNFHRFSVSDVANAFDRCTNLQLGAKVLVECYSRSGSNLGKALSCYYSGNFETGFKHGYVQRVLAVLGQSKKNSDSTPNRADSKVGPAEQVAAASQTVLQSASSAPAPAIKSNVDTDGFLGFGSSTGSSSVKRLIPSAHDGAFVF